MKENNRRLVWAATILAFFFLAAAARLWHIQVGRGEYYARMALAGETTEVALEDYARGRILDRHLLPLTGSYVSNRIIVFPQALEDRDTALRRLSAVLGVDPEALQSLVADKKPVVLPYAVSGSQLEAIDREALKGVVVAPYSFRYGSRVLAAHVVGYLGKIKDGEMEKLSPASGKNYKLSDWTGRQGLEYFYEKELKGAYSYGLAGIFTDARGNPLAGLPPLVDTGLGDSTRCDIVTTIDAGIQDVVESVMDRRIRKGAVVVMDSASGDILAMASRPSYNPDPAVLGQDGGQEEDERFINQAISCFQPGSVFKVVVAAAALSEGAVGPDTSFVCQGSEDRPIRCWYPQGHGRINFSQAFAQSCNPVFVKVGQSLGAGKIIDYARKMGLDNQSLLGFPAPADSRQNLDLIAAGYNLVNSCIGQGPVLATPLQITAMTNTIATGGMYLQPRLVKEIRGAKGLVREIRGPEPVRAISPEVASQVGDMMAGVTREGVGRRAWVDQGGAAGKTGSAEIGGESGMINAWFSGYTPLEKPRFTITVLVREGVSGAASAAPVFKEIAEGIAHRQSINPQ